MTPWRETAVAVALALAAASVRAQGADPPPPSVSELARLEEQKREIEKLRKQLDETTQLSLSAHNRLEGWPRPLPPPRRAPPSRSG